MGNGYLEKGYTVTKGESEMNVSQNVNHLE